MRHADQLRRLYDIANILSSLDLICKVRHGSGKGVWGRGGGRRGSGSSLVTIFFLHALAGSHRRQEPHALCLAQRFPARPRQRSCQAATFPPATGHAPVAAKHITLPWLGGGPGDCRCKSVRTGERRLDHLPTPGAPVRPALTLSAPALRPARSRSRSNNSFLASRPPNAPRVVKRRRPLGTTRPPSSHRLRKDPAGHCRSRFTPRQHR